MGVSEANCVMGSCLSSWRPWGVCQRTDGHWSRPTSSPNQAFGGWFFSTDLRRVHWAIGLRGDATAPPIQGRLAKQESRTIGCTLVYREDWIVETEAIQWHDSRGKLSETAVNSRDPPKSGGAFLIAGPNPCHHKTLSYLGQMGRIALTEVLILLVLAFRLPFRAVKPCDSDW